MGTTYYGFGYYPIDANPDALAATVFEVTSVLVNGLGLVQINFSKNVRLTSVALDPASYVITSEEWDEPLIKSVLTLEDVGISTRVQLQTSPLVRGGTYMLDIVGAVTSADNDLVVVPSPIEFVAKESKFELIKDKLPPGMYIDLDSTDAVTHFIGAVAIEDDAIGGGAANVP